MESYTITIDVDNYLDVLEVQSFYRRIRGLTGSDEIPRDGMIFRFNKQMLRPVSMRGMNYDLDVIWIDSGYEVRAVETLEHPTGSDHLRPDSAEHYAKYVVETRAGWAEEHGVEEGDIVDGL